MNDIFMSNPKHFMHPYKISQIAWSLYIIEGHIYEDSAIRKKFITFQGKPPLLVPVFSHHPPSCNVIRHQGGGDQLSASIVPVSYFQVVLRTLEDILKGQARTQRNRELGVGVVVCSSFKDAAAAPHTDPHSSGVGMRLGYCPQFQITGPGH